MKRIKALVVLCCMVVACISYGAQNEAESRDVQAELKQLQKLFMPLHKRGYKVLMDPKSTYIKLAHSGARYERWANLDIIEKGSGTKREWFERVAKGFKIASTMKRDAKDSASNGRKSEEKKYLAMFDKTKDKLVALIKSRKKEYSVKR